MQKDQSIPRAESERRDVRDDPPLAFHHEGKRYPPGSGIIIEGRKYIVGSRGELRRLDKLLKRRQDGRMR